MMNRFYKIKNEFNENEKIKDFKRLMEYTSFSDSVLMTTRRAYSVWHVVLGQSTYYYRKT